MTRIGEEIMKGVGEIHYDFLIGIIDIGFFFFFFETVETARSVACR